MIWREPRCVNCGRTKSEDALITRGQVCGRCVYPGQPNLNAIRTVTWPPPGEPVVVPDIAD